MLAFFLTLFVNQYLSSLPGYSVSECRQNCYCNSGLRILKRDVFPLNRNFVFGVSNHVPVNWKTLVLREEHIITIYLH